MDTDVVIAGAGPAGSMLATELALAGVEAVVVEALKARSGQSKATNLQPRTAEILEMRGLLTSVDERSIGRVEGGEFAGNTLDYAALDSRYPYQVGVPQARVEEILEDRLAELGREVRRNWQLTGFDQDDGGVTVHGPEQLRARYLIGCDGGRSTVRKLLGVEFAGTDATRWTAPQGPDPERKTLREILAMLLNVPDANRVAADMMSGLDIDYGGAGHVGGRLPDFKVDKGWASQLFHKGQGVLLARDEKYLAPAAPYQDRIAATVTDTLPWGDVQAVLIRPDGYVCWTAPGEEITGALRKWF